MDQQKVPDMILDIRTATWYQFYMEALTIEYRAIYKMVRSILKHLKYPVDKNVDNFEEDYKKFMELKETNEYTKEIFDDELVNKVLEWYRGATDFNQSFTTDDTYRRVKVRQGETLVREFYDRVLKAIVYITDIDS